MEEEAPRLKKVAIADDSPAFLAAAANYVASLPGYMLAGTASNPPQTLELVEHSMPDVLLLDLGMGPKRGMELVQQVKASASAPAVSVASTRTAPKPIRRTPGRVSQNGVCDTTTV